MLLVLVEYSESVLDACMDCRLSISLWSRLAAWHTEPGTRKPVVVAIVVLRLLRGVKGWKGS